MKKSRSTTEQIIGFSKQADAGMAVAELARQNGFSPASFCAWRAKYGGMGGRGRQAAEGARVGERPAQEAAGRGPPRYRGPEDRLLGKTLVGHAENKVTLV